METVKQYLEVTFIVRNLDNTHSLLQCFEFNKFEGFETERELETASLGYIGDNKLWAGLVFEMNATAGNTIPSYVKYKIRMDVSRSDSTRRGKVLDRFNHCSGYPY